MTRGHLVTQWPPHTHTSTVTHQYALKTTTTPAQLPMEEKKKLNLTNYQTEKSTKYSVKHQVGENPKSRK